MKVTQTIKIEMPNTTACLTKDEVIELRDLLLKEFPVRPVANFRDFFPKMDFPPVNPYSPANPSPRFGPALTGSPNLDGEIYTTSEEKTTPTPSSGISIKTREIDPPPPQRGPFGDKSSTL